MQMKKRVDLLVAIVVSFFTVLACAPMHRLPTVRFDAASQGPAPDYKDTRYWCALPEIHDFADLTPLRDSPESQDSAQVDVFYIHPTTFSRPIASRKHWNADLQNERINSHTDKWPIRHQAGVFNASGRVYAPRYRQMVLGGFYAKKDQEKADRDTALAFAYQDIRAAFIHYLDYYNQGRPIAIASHSQGTVHGIRLIREFFDGKQLQNQLVAAYLIGWPFFDTTFTSIPTCDSAPHTGCVIGWNTWKENYIPRKWYDSFLRGSVVVNPLSWHRDELPASEALHKGFLSPNFKKIHAGKIHAGVHDGLLWVNNPFAPLPLKNFHVADYNLFWLDIRENFARRVAVFVKGKDIPH